MEKKLRALANPALLVYSGCSNLSVADIIESACESMDDFLRHKQQQKIKDNQLLILQDENFNPIIKSEFITTEADAEDIDDDDCIKFSRLNFGKSATQFWARIAVSKKFTGQTIELRLDRKDGPLIATMVIENPTMWKEFQDQYIETNTISGLHDLYLVIRGQHGLGTINFFALSQFQEIGRP